MLRDYILAQPELSAHVTAGNDGAIADWLNTPAVPKVSTVERSVFAGWCGATGLRAAIQDHSQNPASPLRSIALTTLDFLLGGVATSIDFAKAENMQMLAAWEQAGPITAEQKAALMALATKQISRAESQGYGHVSVSDVAKALRNDDGTPTW